MHTHVDAQQQHTVTHNQHIPTADREVQNLLLESCGIRAALSRRENVLCFRDRALNPELKSNAALILIPRLVR